MTARTTISFAKFSAILLLFLLSVILVTKIHAEDASSSTGTTAPVKGPLFQPKLNTRIQIRTDNMQDKMAARKAQIASREAMLKTKLNAFRDQRKAQIASRVNTNLNQINQNQTDQMLKFLDKASAILDKLEARVNQNTPDIKDPTAAKTAIADARTKIAAAQDAVKAQQVNDYTITVTSESSVKKDAQNARQKLHTDLLTVRKTVVGAKQAVAAAISVARGSVNKVATPSAKEATASGQ